jgi:hypothetical protein
MIASTPPKRQLVVCSGERGRRLAPVPQLRCDLHDHVPPLRLRRQTRARAGALTRWLENASQIAASSFAFCARCSALVRLADSAAANRFIAPTFMAVWPRFRE